MAWGLPLNLLALAANVLLGAQAGARAWALFCVSCAFASLAQPAVGQALPAALAGRALSAFNLLIFGGVFTVQWGIGLGIDFFRGMGWPVGSAYRGAFALFAACCLFSYFVALVVQTTPRGSGAR